MRQQVEVCPLNSQGERCSLRGIHERVVLVEVGENVKGRVEGLLRPLGLPERVAFEGEEQVPANGA